MVIRSISLGVLAVAATALLAGLTLLPAVLGMLGPRVERLRVWPKRPPKPETQGFWYRWSHSIMRRPWVWLARLARAHRRARAAGAQPEDARLDGEAPAAQTPSRVQGLDYINSQFGNNALNPIQIVLKTEPGGVFTPKFLTGLDKLSNTLAADRRANGVTSLATYMAAEPR